MPKVIINDSEGLKQVTGTGVEVNSSVNFSGELVGQKSNVSILEDGTSLTSADSGKVFLLHQGGPKTATLPSPESGVHFKFILTLAGGDAWRILQAGPDDHFVGNVLFDGGNAQANTGHTYINFDVGATTGDEVELVSDGVAWYVRGSSRAGFVNFG